MQTTVVVNEAYIKLFSQREVDRQNRGHFFAIAAQVMRRILIAQKY
jgi:RNA polymerase sigma-70 factor (ECF subfamily)